MMRPLTHQEVLAWQEQVDRLRASASLEDQIVAILMDTHIGDAGERESVAREKARAILDRLKAAEKITSP